MGSLRPPLNGVCRIILYVSHFILFVLSGPPR